MLQLIASGPFGLSEEAMGAFLFIWIGFPVSLFLGFWAGLLLLMGICAIFRVHDPESVPAVFLILFGGGGAAGGLYMLFWLFG